MSQVLGMRELQGNVKSLNRALDQAEDPAALAAGEPIRDAWRSLVPVEDGHYRDAITVTWLKHAGKAGVGTAWMTSLPRDKQPFVYSQVLEFGNSDTAAQPSARPALKAAKGEAVEAAGVVLKTRVKGRPRKRTPL